MSIYTKTGDKGETSLYSGGKFPKSSQVFEVLGNMDELNASLGLVKAPKSKEINTQIHKIQSELFEIGTYIADQRKTAEADEFLKTRTESLESLIDLWDKELPELKNFILPGGTNTAAQLHLSRAICRRLERSLVRYLEEEKLEETEYRKYFNRLSDLLFVMARYSNHKGGVSDIIWGS
jgi:cob(I)alamin adenosyltransferase